MAAKRPPSSAHRPACDGTPGRRRCGDPARLTGRGGKNTAVPPVGAGVCDDRSFHAIGVMELGPAPGGMVPDGERRDVGQTARFQETLRRLAMIDEGFVENEAGLGLGLAGISALDHKTAALLQLGVSVAIGSPGVCLEWGTGRALAAGASEDEIADVLLAIAPVAGLGRVVCAAPGVAVALGYDIDAAMEER